MYTNYHTHTWRCHHAAGSEKEYVEQAIQAGLKVLGFSDHTPYPFHGGYISTIRMQPGQLEDYVNTVLSLKKEYQNDIQIHLGLEVEYYPAFFDELLELVSDYPVEYFLLAQHFLGNEAGDFYSGAETQNPDHLIRYCNQIIEAFDRGCFTYLAHPDLIHFTGDPVIYEKQIRRLCRKAKSRNIPLEINFLGLHEKRHYPNAAFWKIAGEEGNDVIFGIDAHRPSALQDPQTLQKALAMVEKYNLHLLWEVPFKPVIPGLFK